MVMRGQMYPLRQRTCAKVFTQYRGFGASKSIACLSAVLALLGCFPAACRSAEVSPPEAGAILRNIKPELPPTPKKPSTLQIPEPQGSAGQSDVKVVIKGWRITGAQLFSAAELEQSLKSYVGQPVSLAELRNAASDLSLFYRRKGYFATAVLPPQEIRDGIVEVAIREARLGNVEVEGGEGVFQGDRARKTMIAAHPQGETLKLRDLERGILLLNDLPGSIVSSTLKAGRKVGDSDLGLKLSSSQLLSGSLDYGNAGVHSVGMHQYGGTLALNNPLKVGDLAMFRLQGGSGNVYGRLAYTVPIAYSGLKLGWSVSGLYYSLGAPFENLAAHGSAWSGGVFATYPLIRGVNGNLYASTGFDDRRYYNAVLGETLSDKEVQVGYLGLSGDYQDHAFSGAVTHYGVTASIGSLDLSGNRTDEELNDATARSSGAYQKFILSFSRLQRVSDEVRLYLGLSGQLATKNLDSSEKFSLGGPYGVRAYPVNEALGDQGYLFNFEVRYSVYKDIELLGFIDHGGVNLHVDTWSGSNSGVPNNYTLSGGGVGVNWTAPGNFSIRGTVAQRIGSNPARNPEGRDSDGSYETPHFWVSLSKYF
jgi:hemolysin activation/secretion protein